MPDLIGATVQLTQWTPLFSLGAVDLVVLTERPYTDRPAPWVEVPAVLYELHWPDGGTTWHRRHEFEPIGV